MAKTKTEKETMGLQMLFKTPSKKMHYQGNKEPHLHPADTYDAKDLKKAAKQYTGVEPKKKSQAITILEKEGQVFPAKTGRTKKMEKEESMGLQMLFKTSKAPSKKMHYQGNKEPHLHPADTYDAKDLKKAAKQYTGVEPKKKSQAITILEKEGQVFPTKTGRTKKMEKEESMGLQMLFKAPSKKMHYQGNKEPHLHPADTYDAKDLKKAAKQYTGVEPKKKSQAITILEKEGQVFPAKTGRTKKM